MMGKGQIVPGALSFSFSPALPTIQRGFLRMRESKVVNFPYFSYMITIGKICLTIKITCLMFFSRPLCLIQQCKYKEKLNIARS